MISSTPLADLSAAATPSHFALLVAEADKLLDGSGKDINAQWPQTTRSFTSHPKAPAYIEGKPITVNTFVNKNLNSDHWNKRTATIEFKDQRHAEALFRDLNRYLMGTVDQDQLDNDSHVFHEKQYIKELVDFQLVPLDNQSPTVAATATAASTAASTSASTSTAATNATSVGNDHHYQSSANDRHDGLQRLTYLAKLHYHFPFPVKDRMFHVLLHVAKGTTASYIVQLPIQPEFFNKISSNGSSNGGSNGSKQHPINQQDLVPAQYVSVERITLHTDGSSSNSNTKLVKWEMCTSANPGGLIPLFLSRFNMDKIIASDVPKILEYVGSASQ